MIPQINAVSNKAESEPGSLTPGSFCVREFRVNQASDYPVHTPVRIDEGPSEFLIRKLLQFNRSKQIEMSDTDV